MSPIRYPWRCRTRPEVVRQGPSHLLFPLLSVPVAARLVCGRGAGDGPETCATVALRLGYSPMDGSWMATSATRLGSVLALAGDIASAECIPQE